jgi:outer membrane lipoprotein SlyB
MGAIAGGTAGYYGGGKVGSGHKIIGALAGAFAGHKLEESLKHKQGQNQQGGKPGWPF